MVRHPVLLPAFAVANPRPGPLNSSYWHEISYGDGA
jgi:hypothetical protein